MHMVVMVAAFWLAATSFTGKISLDQMQDQGEERW
jgi:hypothetical protein